MAESTVTHANRESKAEPAGRTARTPAHGRGLVASVRALQRAAGNQTVSESIGDLPEHVHAILRSPGQPLDAAARAEMEARFGEDFGDVRIHADTRAHASARGLLAKAYTIGRHIAFSVGRYLPGTDEGRRLLAHELTHVVQQRRGGSAPPLNASAPHEYEAAAVSRAASAGQAVSVQGATGVGLARAPDDGQNAITPEELWKIVQSQRGFSATEPGHAVEAAKEKVNELEKKVSADPKNKTLQAELKKAQRHLKRTQKHTLKVDPAGVGKPIGQGYATYAAVQIVDANGKMVAFALGSFDKAGHAEEHAINQLKAQLAGRQVPGGRIEVAVDQVVCGKCRKALQAFAKEIGVGSVDAYYPTRPPVGKTTGKVSPKTAARGSVQKGRDVTLDRDRVYTGGGTPGKPPPTPTPSPTPEAKKTPTPATKAEAKKRVITRHAKNTDFQTKGRVKHTDRSGSTYSPPQTQMRGRTRTKFKPKGAGLAEVLPAAMNALQDKIIRHRVAVDMLHQWSKLEKWRRDHPNDVIIAVVSLQEWEHPDPAGQVARAVNYVEFYHGATVAEAEAKTSGLLRRLPPSGWREVGPFIGIIQPTDDLDEVKEHVEDQEGCFIATACYGSALAPEVALLRTYRDAVLRQSRAGRAFIRLYYATSPPVAEFLRRHEQARRAVRVLILRPIVASVRRWTASRREARAHA